MKYRNCLTYDQCMKKLETVTCDRERMRLADLCIYTDRDLAGEEYDHMCRISRESYNRVHREWFSEDCETFADHLFKTQEGTFFETLFKANQTKEGIDK